MTILPWLYRMVSKSLWILPSSNISPLTTNPTFFVALAPASHLPTQHQLFSA